MMRFWPNHDIAPDFSYTAPDGSQIEEKQCLRDLGVIVSSDYSFASQIEAVATSARQMTGWALRTFRGRGKILMVTVMKSLIQPRFDYCCQLWSPRDQLSINKLEKIQMQFVNQIQDDSLRGLNYWEKLKELGLQSQERQRERAQICLLWKMSQGLVDGYDVQWKWSERKAGWRFLHH